MIWRERPELRDPVMVCAFKGWNDAGEAASAALSLHPRSFDAERGRAASTRRSSTTSRRCARRCGSTEGRTREIDWPENSFSAAAGARRRGRSRAAPGRRAVAALAPLHRGPGRGGARARRAHGDHARRAAGRRAAHAARCRSPASRRTTALVERLGFERTSYEGPTGHRRRAARTPAREAGLPVGEPVGVGAALRGRGAQPEGRARAGARVRGHRRRRGGRRASSRAPPRTTSAR